MRRFLQSFLTIVLFSYSWWSLACIPPPAQTPQDVQAALCTAAHIAGNLQQQQAIEATCSADNPGSQFTTIDFLAAAVQSGFGTEEGVRVVLELQDDANAGTHMSAGESYGAFSVWGSINWTSLDNDFASTAATSTAHSFMVGADLQPTDDMIVGLALGLENNDINTIFNGGSQDITGVTGLGYLGYLINDSTSVDVSIGTTSVNIEQDRTFGAAAGSFAGVAAGTLITSEVDAQRYFGAVNLNGFWSFDDWGVGASAGYLRAHESRDAFTETGGGVSAGLAGSDTDVGQIRVGDTVSYSVDAFEPYVGLDYVNEISRDDVVVSGAQTQPSNDEDEILFSAGFRYFSPGGMAASLAYEKSFSRDDIDVDSVFFSLRTEW